MPPATREMFEARRELQARILAHGQNEHGWVGVLACHAKDLTEQYWCAWCRRAGGLLGYLDSEYGARLVRNGRWRDAERDRRQERDRWLSQLRENMEPIPRG